MLSRSRPQAAPLRATRTRGWRQLHRLQDAAELLDGSASLDDGHYRRLQRGALEWARANTTVERARVSPRHWARRHRDPDSPLDTAAELEAEQDVLEASEAGDKVIRGGATSTLGYIAGILLGLLSTPFMVRHLGVEDFGRFVTVGSLIFIAIGLTEGGLSAIGVREYSTRGEDGRYRLIRNLLGMRIVLTLPLRLGGAVGLAATGYDDVLLARHPHLEPGLGLSAWFLRICRPAYGLVALGLASGARLRTDRLPAWGLSPWS